jgi:hypothetical protein
MGSVNAESRPVRVDDVVFFPHDGATFLHHLDSGHYFKLNTVAGEVWELCEGALAVAEIADLLVETFAAEREDVIADVTDLVQELHDQECVTLA